MTESELGSRAGKPLSRNPHVQHGGKGMEPVWKVRSSQLERGVSNMAEWPSFPGGLVSVQSRSNRGGLYITPTHELQKTAIDPGEYVFFEYNPGSPAVGRDNAGDGGVAGGGEPLDTGGGATVDSRAEADYSDTAESDGYGLIHASKVEKPDNYDPNVDLERKVRDQMNNGQSVRVSLPHQLAAYDLGIDTDNYTGDDPFLLHFGTDWTVPSEERQSFYLQPLGYASELFRAPHNHDVTSPIPAALAGDYAGHFDLDAEAFRAFLDELTAWVTRDTLERLDRDLDANIDVEPVAPPTVTEYEGRDLMVQYLPEGAFEAFDLLFRPADGYVQGAWNLHREIGVGLVEAAFDADGTPIPSDHPIHAVVDGELSALVLPVTVDLTSGFDTSGRMIVPPVTNETINKVVGRIPADRATLAGALSALSSELSSTDRGVTVPGTTVSRLHEPITVSMDPGHEIEAQYDQVHIEFIPDGASEQLARAGVDLNGVDDEEDSLVTALTTAYNDQSEQLLRDADVDPKLSRFRGVVDTVIVPADTTE